MPEGTCHKSISDPVSIFDMDKLSSILIGAHVQEQVLHGFLMSFPALNLRYMWTLALQSFRR